jgi:lipase chaperone LimK
MASTRAKSRALRDFVNVGMTAFEELGSLDEVVVNESSEKATARKPLPRKQEVSKSQPSKKEPEPPAPAQQQEAKHQEAPHAAKQEGLVPGVSPDTDAKKKQEQKPSSGMSEAQKRAIYNLSRRRGLSVEELQNYVKQRYNVETVEELKPADASAFIHILQQAA